MNFPMHGTARWPVNDSISDLTRARLTEDSDARNHGNRLSIAVLRKGWRIKRNSFLCAGSNEEMCPNSTNPFRVLLPD